jgi:hypothetical protein
MAYFVDAAHGHVRSPQLQAEYVPSGRSTGLRRDESGLERIRLEGVRIRKLWRGSRTIADAIHRRRRSRRFFHALNPTAISLAFVSPILKK